MKQEEIYLYLKNFFSANGCEITEKPNATLQVKLTERLDEALMNRPFYWHYIRATGGKPETRTLNLTTDETLMNEKDLEFIHTGSPRLHQIFQTAKSAGIFTRMYEKARVEAGNQLIPLTPWLGVNYKISYQCDMRKDQIVSLGLNLINGTMIRRFDHYVSHQQLTAKIPDYCYTITPLIKPRSGGSRLESLIRTDLSSEDHHWAEEAVRRRERDLILLKSFYPEDSDIDRDAYQKEKAAICGLYDPYIEISVINGGLFYLSGNFLTSLTG